ncbi:MAG: 1-acyl-sn-glycerol-3-phosphate acyltransferase [Paramuribaculum sp.]|nr:1-acyl-sn-glycerol-3-phosphate acyltransferase [Paramuribaculum sp.]MDE6324472.1 1-acyl-sn-glycerol-3-phosphate acyltransferase [Paramuribaculum sp.]MDE6488556.1 1-acyl-sn-glycerol-3-phosphate acyltransferase [Paramuribaculum sp.]
MIVLYRIYQLLIMAPVLLVATIVAALTTIIGCALGGGRWWGYYPARWWGRLFCIMSLVRVKVTGAENIDPATSYVFVANHQGAYDIFSIYGYLPHKFRWMMKASLRKIPLVGYACEKAHQIYVDKSSPSALRHTMERAEEVLRGGTSLVVFPEGARTWNGHMRPFKRGAFTLANEFSLPLVPVTIDGAFDIMPRTRKIPRPGTIRLTIHPPIPSPENPARQAEAIKRCFDDVHSALPGRHQ